MKHRSLRLKITDFEIYQLGEPSSQGSATWAGNSILLRLTTSDGTIGYGEAVPTLRVQSVIQSLHEVGRVYKGRDPLDMELNIHEWHKHDFYLPVSFESTTALSAFDIACWDILGKHLGAPIHQLVGGSFRNSVRVYANGWYDKCVTPEQFGERAKKFAAIGYTALKFDPFGTHYDSIDVKGLETAYARVKAVKDATASRIELLIEHHGRFDPNAAIAIAKKLAEFDPLFMEEPVHPDNFEADYLQIDITNIGGVTIARKVAAMAEAYGVEMAFHNAFGPIQNAVTVQLDATLPNFLIQESFYDCFPAWKRQLVRDQSRVVNGQTKVPTRPGIGVEVDEKVLEEHRAEGQEYFNPDEPVWVVKDTWKD